MIAASCNRKQDGSEFAATKCKKSWVEFVASGATVNRRREHIDEYLSRIERAGVERFYWYDAILSCVRDPYRDLGVVRALVWHTGSTISIIKLSLTPGGRAVGATRAVEV